MYVRTKVTLTDINGDEADYEVGGEVEEAYIHDGTRDRYAGLTVGEPEVSAAGSDLDCSRLYPDPQGGESLAKGWSDAVTEALESEYDCACSDMCADYDSVSDLDPDEFAMMGEED